MSDARDDAFACLQLAPRVLANLAELGYSAMTPIQAAALPLVLAGRDVIAQAKTGSGKTVAFGLGLLARVDPRRPAPQAFVLCPTRELADQVTGEIRKLARITANLKVLTLCGGVPLGPQIASLRHGAHVVVGTPGRVGKHLRDGRLDPSHVEVVVLDEGDRMLDMGFAPEILDILATTPASRQTLLFSATFPPEIERMSAEIQRDPVRVSVDEAHAAGHIEQTFFEVARASADEAIANLLAHHQPSSTLVFCNTRIRCAALTIALRRAGIAALALHGDLEQPDRDRALCLFANGSARVMVATDVAARGLDVDGLAAVINAELPLDPEVYVHRIGRTGRAGRGGIAFALFDPDEVGRLRAIESFQGARARVESLPRAEAQLAEASPRFPAPARVTLAVDAGRRDKLRPGDVLGALTNAGGIAAANVGKIDVGDRVTYVAIDREFSDAALLHLQRTPIKGRRIAVTRVRADG